MNSESREKGREQVSKGSKSKTEFITNQSSSTAQTAAKKATGASNKGHGPLGSVSMLHAAVYVLWAPAQTPPL